MTMINWKTKTGTKLMVADQLADVRPLAPYEPTIWEQLQVYAPYAIGGLALLLLLRN